MVLRKFHRNVNYTELFIHENTKGYNVYVYDSGLSNSLNGVLCVDPTSS